MLPLFTGEETGSESRWGSTCWAVMGPGLDVEKPRKGERAVQGIKYHLPHALSPVHEASSLSALSPAASCAGAGERSLAPRVSFRVLFCFLWTLGIT